MYKLYIKKLFYFILLIIITFTFGACKKVELTISGENTLEVGETTTLSILEEVGEIVFDSNNKRVATVDERGMVNACNIGEAEISVTSKNAVGTFKITVIAKKYIEINNINNLVVGETKNLSVKLLPENSIIDAKFESSNPFVAYVADGKVVALSVGEANIIATYTTAKNKILSDVISVKVVNDIKKIEKVEISGRNVVMKDKSIELKCTTSPLKDEKVIWSSTNPSIATIDKNGVVTGLIIGNVTIIATSEVDSKINASIEISVVENMDGTTYLGANYIVNDIVEYNELPYGVLHTKNISQTSTPLSGVDADGYSGITEEIVPDKLYPQQVNVLEVPSSKDIKITTWANLDNNKWALTTVRGLIQKYEKANPGWKVIAAINGDFFDINANGNLPYQTSGAMISGGEFYKTNTGNTVGFTNDGTANSLIGNKKITRTENMILAIYDENDKIVKEFNINKLNAEPGANETSIYFANYDSNKSIVPFKLNLDGKKGYVVGEAIKALPNSTTDFYGLGVISSTSTTIITAGNFAIVTKNAEVDSALKIGTKIRCQYEYTGDYANVTDATGCGGTLLPATESSINDRAPRTVIGKKADGTIVMMVIDGRQGNKDMYGADARELAAIMSAYGCVEAYNLDGGGSSTMVIREGDTFVTKNSPSDGRERSDSNCILVVVKDPIIEYSVSEISQNDITLNINVTDSMGKDIKRVFIEHDSNFYDVIDDTVNISNLVHNTKYEFDIYYETSTGVIYKSLTSGSFTTLKNMPIYYNFVVEETDEAYEFYIYYNDIDGASTLKNATLKCNGFTLFMRDGHYTFKKSYIKDGSPLSDIYLTYSYQLGTERRTTVEIQKVDYLYIDHRTK